MQLPCAGYEKIFHAVLWWITVSDLCLQVRLSFSAGKMNNSKEFMFSSFSQAGKDEYPERIHVFGQRKARKDEYLKRIHLSEPERDRKRWITPNNSCFQGRPASQKNTCRP
jgi:hypothetical protein